MDFSNQIKILINSGSYKKIVSTCILILGSNIEKESTHSPSSQQ